MYNQLNEISRRPEAFSAKTTEILWNDPHISMHMLEMHLDEQAEPASRNKAFIDKSLSWMTERFSIGPGFRIGDFGCGPGLYTTPLAEKGARVTGIDFSTRSIAYAKEQAAIKGLNINYVKSDYLQYNTEQRFDLITLIYCDFCALGPDDRSRLLRKFRTYLDDGGCLLMDVFSLASFAARKETTTYGRNLMNGFWSPDDYHGFMNTFRYANERVVLDKYTIIEAGRTRTIYNWLQYYDYESLVSELAENGFQVEGCYADVAGNPLAQDSTEIAIVATKRP